LFAPVPAGRIEALEDPEADRYNTAILEYNAAVEYLTKNEFPAAAERFRKAIGLFPEFFEANLNTAVVYDVFLEQPEKAGEIYKRLLEVNPGDTRLIRLLQKEKEAPEKSKKDDPDRTPESDDDDTESPTLMKARSALLRGEYGVAGREFQEALEEELSLAEETEALRGLGIAYSALEFDKAAIQAFEQALYRDPQAKLPEKRYPDRVYRIYDEVAQEFPAPLELKVTTGSVLALTEPVGLDFTITAPCRLKIKITPLGEKDILLEKTVEVKKDSLTDSIEWIAGTSPGFVLRPRTYKVELSTKGKEDWQWTREYSMKLSGNFDAREVRDAAKKEDRFRALQGQLHLTHIPGQKRWELVEKPKMFSWKGFWSYPYYGTVGVIRDGLDFPVKFLYSVPGLGHALTVAHPFLVFTAVEAAQDVKKDDYESIFWGPLSDADEQYKSDKQAAKGNAALAAAASLVAVPAVMSVVSWAGTDDGISKGFLSYYESNAFSNGYDRKYFFPNWRSMDFEVIRDDPEKEKSLLTEAKNKNEGLNGRIRSRNEEISGFNIEKFFKWRFELLTEARKNLKEVLRIETKLGGYSDLYPWEIEKKE
jgi:tetratricopeptide (TPR) repeat protein